MTRATAIICYERRTIFGKCALVIIIPPTRMTMNEFCATNLDTDCPEIAALSR